MSLGAVPPISQAKATPVRPRGPTSRGAHPFLAVAPPEEVSARMNAEGIVTEIEVAIRSVEDPFGPRRAPYPGTARVSMRSPTRQSFRDAKGGRSRDH